MKRENAENNNQDLVEQLMQLILQIRQQAKTDKNWEIADAIRQQLNTIGITVKDTKEGLLGKRC